MTSLKCARGAHFLGEIIFLDVWIRMQNIFYIDTHNYSLVSSVNGLNIRMFSEYHLPCSFIPRLLCSRVGREAFD